MNNIEIFIILVQH